MSDFLRLEAKLARLENLTGVVEEQNQALRLQRNRLRASNGECCEQNTRLQAALAMPAWESVQALPEHVHPDKVPMLLSLADKPGRLDTLPKSKYLVRRSMRV